MQEQFRKILVFLKEYILSIFVMFVQEYFTYYLLLYGCILHLRPEMLSILQQKVENSGLLIGILNVLVFFIVRQYYVYLNYLIT